uniref:Secreted protein n=1 Tax=Anguilla anguilla TaxID=7936 RepID=A0A0E9VR18_ANGAN
MLVYFTSCLLALPLLTACRFTHSEVEFEQQRYFHSPYYLFLSSLCRMLSAQSNPVQRTRAINYFLNSFFAVMKVSSLPIAHVRYEDN